MPKSVFTDAYASAIAVVIELRRQKGVSQVELARRLGKTQQWVSNFERCERRIDIIEFYAIVRALGGEPEHIFHQIVAQLPTSVEI